MAKVLWDGVVVEMDIPDSPPPTEHEIRSERNYKLRSEVDPEAGNVLRWAALTSEQQTALATYRTALLNVPAQAGFPDNVTWPTKP